MRKTIAKIISEPIYHRIGFMEFYKVNLENKEGVFACSFGKKVFQNHSPEKQICLIKCEKGNWGFVGKEIEFLDNDQEITSWEEIIIEKKQKQPTTKNKQVEIIHLLSDDDIFNLLTNRLNLVPQQKGWEAFFLCPFHPHSEIAKLTFEKNTKNFVCSLVTNCQYKKIGDILDFWVKYKNISPQEVLTELSQIDYLPAIFLAEINKKITNSQENNNKELKYCKYCQSQLKEYGVTSEEATEKSDFIRYYCDKCLRMLHFREPAKKKQLGELAEADNISMQNSIQEENKNESYQPKEETTINSEQQKICQLVLSGQNVCFLGEAGTGKSFLLKHLIALLRENYENELFITSCTGRTAINIQGQTLHSFAGIGHAEELSWQQLLTKITNKKEAVNRWKRCKLLIIDEISMLDGELFDKLEIIARQIKRVDKPFGGIQLVICGDFFQLSPIEKNYKWCFEASSWLLCVLNIIHLKQIYRQNDNQLINLLKEVRDGHLSADNFTLLDSLKREPRWPDDGIQPTQLYASNEEIDRVNLDELTKLPAAPLIYYAQDKENRSKTLSVLTKNCLAAEKLELKIGAQVMLTINQFERKLFNGSQGTIINFKKEEGEKYPIVKFSGGRIAVIKPFEYKLLEYRDNQEIILASRKQLPLMLSWAITIHKSQGQTIERLKIDCEKIWAEGQLYVALSRATNIEYLQVINFQRGKIRTSQRVKGYYRNLRSE